jgi:signal transduction histidine kinase
VLLLGLGGGWWLSARAIRPLDAITATAVRIADGRLDERIDVADTDSELGQLATVLNSTFARLELSFAQQAQFTADAAHELRTPVSVIISQAQLGLRGERSAAEYREMLEACLRAAKRMQKLTQSLLELARHDAGALVLQRECCDPRVARPATPPSFSNPTPRSCQITSNSISRPRPVTQIPIGLRRSFLNLLTNALEHTPAGGRVTVHTSAEARRDACPSATPARHCAGTSAQSLRPLLSRRCLAEPSHRRSGSWPGDLQNHRRGPRRQTRSRERDGQGSTFTLWPAGRRSRCEHFQALKKFAVLRRNPRPFTFSLASAR